MNVVIAVYVYDAFHEAPRTDAPKSGSKGGKKGSKSKEGDDKPDADAPIAGKSKTT